MNIRAWKQVARAAVIAVVAASLGGCITLDVSPDGSRIAFTWGTQGKSGLAIINTDGTGYREIGGGDFGGMGRWSPESQRLAYVDDVGLRIYDVRTGRSTPVVVPNAAAPVWTKDGSQVAVLIADPDTKQNEVAWYSIMERKLGQRIPLTHSPDSFPAFLSLPTTEGVAYLAKGNVRVVEFGEDRAITTTGDVVGFTLAPNNREILFARRSANSQFILLSLYRYDLQLRSVQKVPFPAQVAGINPKPRTGPHRVDYVMFSPDATKMLVYATITGTPSKTGEGQDTNVLYRVDRNGANGTELWRGPAGKTNVIAVWAPGSDRVVMLDQDAKDVMRLITARGDGSGKRVLRTRAAPKP